MTHTTLRTATVVDAEPGPGRPRRRRRTWVAVGGLVTVAVLAAGAYGMSRDESPTAAPSAAASGAEGALNVTVTGTRCQVPSVGPNDLTQRAAGEFCLVDVVAKNTGAEPLLLDQGAQRALDAQGNAHPVSEAAWVFLNDGRPSLLDEIPAGGEVSGVLPFDVPRGTTLSTLELHESIASAGTSVPLR